jgi:hypothetical protein
MNGEKIASWISQSALVRRLAQEVIMDNELLVTSIHQKLKK